jgi:hypothetical protein
MDRIATDAQVPPRVRKDTGLFYVQAGLRARDRRSAKEQIVKVYV